MRLPWLLILFLFVIGIVTDWLSVVMLKKYNVARKWRNMFLLAAFVCFILLIVLISLPRRSSELGINFVMWGIYTYVSLLVSQFIGLIVGYIALIPVFRKQNSRTHGGLWASLLTFIVLFSIFMYGAFVTRRQIDVEKVVFSSPRLPAEFNNFRIVQFSDAHLGTWGNDTTFVSSMADTINSLRPDLIVFSGDIVNRKSDELLPFVKCLSRLKAKYGVYSVLGNHDYGDYISWSNESLKKDNLKLMKDLQRNMGWVMLNDSLSVIRNGSDSIILIGVENWGEPPFRCYGNLDRAFGSGKDKKISKGDDNFKVLLSHNPEHWNQIVSKESNIDLTLSGHTHAMQCMIKIGNRKLSPARLKYPQWGGMYNRVNEHGQQTSLYVNIGVGEVAIPARLGATPEITLITLTNPEINGN